MFPKMLTFSHFHPVFDIIYSYTVNTVNNENKIYQKT